MLRSPRTLTRPQALLAARKMGFKFLSLDPSGTWEGWNHKPTPNMRYWESHREIGMELGVATSDEHGENLVEVPQ